MKQVTEVERQTADDAIDKAVAAMLRILAWDGGGSGMGAVQVEAAKVLVGYVELMKLREPSGPLMDAETARSFAGGRRESFPSGY